MNFELMLDDMVKKSKAFTARNEVELRGNGTDENMAVLVVPVIYLDELYKKAKIVDKESKSGKSNKKQAPVQPVSTDAADDFYFPLGR